MRALDFSYLLGFHHLSYQEQDAINVAVAIAILFVLGGLLLLNQYNYDPEKWSLRRYSPEKLLRASGLYLWGVSLSLVPSLIGVLIDQKWLIILTVIVFLAVSIALTIVERKGFLKPTDEN